MTTMFQERNSVYFVLGNIIFPQDFINWQSCGTTPTALHSKSAGCMHLEDESDGRDNIYGTTLETQDL